MNAPRIIRPTLLGVIIVAAILAAPRALIDVRWRLRMATAGEENPYDA